MQLTVTVPCYYEGVRVKNTGLTWKLSRHICHVEDKAHHQHPRVSQFPSKLPPPEQPSVCESEVPSWDHIIASFLSDNVAVMVVKGV